MSQTINASSLAYFLPFMTLVGVFALLGSFIAFNVTPYQVSVETRRVVYSARWTMLFIAIAAMLLPLIYTMFRFSISYAELWKAASEWQTTEGKLVITASLYVITISPVAMIISWVRIWMGEKSLPTEHVGTTRSRFGRSAS